MQVLREASTPICGDFLLASTQQHPLLCQWGHFVGQILQECKKNYLSTIFSKKRAMMWINILITVSSGIVHRMILSFVFRYKLLLFIFVKAIYSSKLLP